MCPPEKLRDDRLTIGSEPPRHFEHAEAFDPAVPPSRVRRISQTFLAVRDVALEVWEASRDRTDDVNQG